MKNPIKFKIKTWERINLFISIISGISVFLTMIPFLLSFYLKQDWLYNQINLKKVENFNAQGYTLYKPIYQGETTKDTAYYLLQEKDNV